MQKNHDGPHAMTDWYPYSRTEIYRDCRIQFCPHFEIKDVDSGAIQVRETATFSAHEASRNRTAMGERVRFYPTEEGNYQEIKG